MSDAGPSNVSYLVLRAKDQVPRTQDRGESASLPLNGALYPHRETVNKFLILMVGPAGLEPATKGL